MSTASQKRSRGVSTNRPSRSSAAANATECTSRSRPPPKASAVSAKTRSRSLIGADVALGHELRVDGVGEIAHRLLDALALVGERELRALVGRAGARSPRRSSACSRRRARAPAFPRISRPRGDPTRRRYGASACEPSPTTSTRTRFPPGTASRCRSTASCAREPSGWPASFGVTRADGDRLGRARPQSHGVVPRARPGRHARAARAARARASLVARAGRARPPRDGGHAPGRASRARGRRGRESGRRHPPRVCRRRPWLLRLQRRRHGAARAPRGEGSSDACSWSTSTCTRATARTRCSPATPTAFTLSINGFRNYPFRRVPGDLELDLPDGTADDAYLDGLAALLPAGAAPGATGALLLPRRRRPVRGRPPRPPRADQGRPARHATPSCGIRSAPRACRSASRSRAGTRRTSATRWRSTSGRWRHSARGRDHGGLVGHRRGDGAGARPARVALRARRTTRGPAARRWPTRSAATSRSAT